MRDGGQRLLAVGGGEAEVAAARHPQVGPPLAGGVEHAGPVLMAECRLGQERDRATRIGERGHVVLALDEVDRLRGDRGGADGLVVALVADVDDREALPRAHLGLVVDLGDERAHSVHHKASFAARPGDHLGRGAVGAEHHGRARGNLRDVVDEHDAEPAEPVDHELVVDDLVVAVDGRVEDAHHPRERLDGHLHAGAEAPWGREQHFLDPHDLRLTTLRPLS